jgi:aromatase
MSQTALREVEHQITVKAPARAAYELIADVGNWPRLFPPSVYVEKLDVTASEERIRIWATANGEIKSWVSRRVLDPADMRVGFRQEVSSAPVASMGGTWVVEPMTADQSRVRLLHDFRAVDDDPESLAWIERAVDRNSRSELAALKANVELATGASDRVMTFADTVAIKGSAADAYDFLNQAQLWSKRLPHVARCSLAEESPGVQLLEMDTRTKDGSSHTTKSVRVCFPHRLIAYKQIGLPALMTAHLGQWRIQETADDVRVTSEHTVVINEENISSVLGSGAGVAEAASFVRAALSTNSLATLGHAKAYAESRSN